MLVVPPSHTTNQSFDKPHHCQQRISFTLTFCWPLSIHVIFITYLLQGAESFLRSYPVNFAASQEIPPIYGTRKFLTVPTSAHHLSLSWANSIQSPTYPYPEPTPSSPHNPLQLPEDPSEYYPPICVLVFRMASFPQTSPPTPCAYL
jgi:hypothetical protein